MDISDVVGEPHEVPSPTTGDRHALSGFYLSPLALAWSAKHYDGYTAQKWAPVFEVQVNSRSSSGMVKNALLLGAITGDLRQGRRGPEDFLTANRALATALDSYRGTDHAKDLVAVAEHYPRLFYSELRDIALGVEVDPNFKALQIRLAEYGAKIEIPYDSGLNASPTP